MRHGLAPDALSLEASDATLTTEHQVLLTGLTPDTRALLIDGTLDAVINQHPHTMVLNCVRIFTNLRDGRSATSGVEPVRISIVLRENLP